VGVCCTTDLSLNGVCIQLSSCMHMRWQVTHDTETNRSPQCAFAGVGKSATAIQAAMDLGLRVVRFNLSSRYARLIATGRPTECLMLLDSDCIHTLMFA
jgi:hypothetical protein